MQFSTLTLALLAATAASALPEPGKLGLPGSKPKPGPSKPTTPKPTTPKPDNGGGSSNKWDAANLAISTASLASDLAFKFKGDRNNCDTLNKQAGCWKGYCWSACNQLNPTWWAWAAKSPSGTNYVSCSADSECLGMNLEISLEGCGC